MDYVYKNSIVTPEQAVGKKRVWGTVEQLLINKSILKEVRSMRRNLDTVLLDYREAFVQFHTAGLQIFQTIYSRQLKT